MLGRSPAQQQHKVQPSDDAQTSSSSLMILLLQFVNAIYRDWGFFRDERQQAPGLLLQPRRNILWFYFRNLAPLLKKDSLVTVVTD